MKEQESPEKGCQWSFQQWNEKMTYFGPNDAIMQSFTKDFYDSLVRESIQNSLDAVDDRSKPVKVSFTFDKISIVDFPSLFGLKGHINGCIETHKGNQRAEELYLPMLEYLNTAAKSEIDIITVSDFNTCGMQYEEGNPKNTFSAFTKSVGLSVKTSKSSGGSFGFGKAAYFQMSPLRTILVSTMTKDGETFFEGVTRLCTHKIGSAEYTDMGYYDNTDGRPSTGDNIPNKFLRTEPGTSITLLGKYSDAGPIAIMKAELVRAVLRNFWLAIYQEKLIVSIANSIHITRSEIGRLIAQNFSQNTKDRNNPRPYFEAFSHSADKQHFHFTDTTPHLGQVQLFIKLSQEARKDRIAYMRKPLMLVETKSLGTSFGLNALFLCLDEKGNELLSNIEDASHSSWSIKGKSGEAKNSAITVLQEIEDFVNACLDKAFDGGSDIEVIDIGIGFSEEDIENLLGGNSENNNPFGTVATGEIVPEGGSITTTIDSTTKSHSSGQEAGNVGRKTKGIMDSNNVTAKKQVGTGHKNKKSKNKGGSATSGTTQSIATPEENDNGQSFTLYTPTLYYAPAYKVDNEWYHDIILNNEEEMDNVFIELKVVTEDGTDSVSISHCSPVGRISSSKGIIKFDHLNQGRVVIKIQFSDKQRHTIKLR